ncbi:hypothetical protein EDC94DRAFT_657727 [Helicostylum pulchrum]|uniref:Uncharacterized protein n=1 Tax=Helicostylum pulchrum TaxID=562976 RepID=A0ABP9YE92_9FUNG|nr:hypothetical protein EDC94DRAFT_657727 [Helicostylum pulchrum]
MKIPGITTERISAIFSRQSKLFQGAEAFTVKAIRNETKTENRVCIVTGKKKIGKSAVIRNRADRRLKAAIQTVYPHLKAKGYDYLVFSQPPAITLPWLKLVEQVKKSFYNIDNKIPKNK